MPQLAEGVGGDLETLCQGLDRSFTTADRALASYINIIVECERDPKLQEMINSQAVQSKMPGLKAKLGFGLHTGWGIEGAIGSELKIDASYLSPNVNLAARLEAATGQFGVSILISEPLWKMLSPPRQKLCRRVDRVMVKGSKMPLTLFTYDLDIKQLSSNKTTPAVESSGDDFDWEEVHRQQVRKVYSDLNQTFWAPLTISDEFRELYDRAIDAYLGGEWRTAGDMMEKCQQLQPSDGPTMTIYNYIARRDFTAPSDWPGARELTSK
jgi:hypothetical protein